MASIFTKIIRGELPCYKVAENETHIAFLDINPVAEGHTLIIPKEEIDYLFDLPDTLLADTILFAKKVALAIDNALGPVRTGVVLDGREVPHAHIHLVPIYSDTQSVSLGRKLDIPGEIMQEIANKIAAEVNL
ncbi:MAG: HIT family protein [Balneolaceae bacterium]|nr:MAG: HIT family protein [Balneolaceae bacterium]